MTSLLVAWVGFPLLLGMLCLGCGLLLEQLAGTPLPRLLLLPAGLAVVTVVADLATMTARTAQLGVPAVIGLAAAGLASSLPWRRPGLELPAVVTATGAYAVYAAPMSSPAGRPSPGTSSSTTRRPSWR